MDLPITQIKQRQREEFLLLAKSDPTVTERDLVLVKKASLMSNTDSVTHLKKPPLIPECIRKNIKSHGSAKMASSATSIYNLARNELSTS